MKAVYIKLIIAAVLFLAWIALVALKVPGSEDLVSFIKTALEGLGLYHAVTFVPSASGTVSAIDAVPGQAFAGAAELAPLAPSAASPAPSQ